MDAQDCFSVIFHNVKECYSPDNAINCQFSVKENTSIDDPENCFVGILVVAWDSLENVIAKKSFTSMELEGRGGIYNLSFHSEETPSSNFEYEEFYQFCFYNIVTKDVFGASCPFQIYNSKEGSLVHIEELNDISENTIPSFLATVEDEVNWWLKGSDKPVDEDLEDTVLIHNKTTLMENALVNAAKDKEQALMVTKLKFESELKQFTSEKKEIIEKSEAEVTNLKQKNKSLTERELSLKQSLIDSQNVVKQLENFAAENTKNIEMLLHNLTVEKKALTKALTDKEAANIEHINKIKTELNAKIEASELRCGDLNESLIAEKKVLEKMEFEYEEIILNLRKELELLAIKEDESVSETSRRLGDLQVKLNAEVTKKYEYLNEIDKLTQSVERLTKQNKVGDSLLNVERDKLTALSVQQQEMTSRLSSENEKICDEIQNLKSHENSLVEAHRKELSCHGNRVAEMESIAKEEKLKYKSDIDQVNNELNDKINCINLLEAKIRESDENTSHMEAHKQEKLELTDTIDELNAKLLDLEQQNLQLSDESKKVSPCKTSESGSMHALLVANAHMQKQLNNLKKEKEINYCQQKSTESNSNLAKENEEFKLRMCMGKKAFDKQYLECQRLRNELKRLKQSVSTGSVNGIHGTQDANMGEEYNSLLLEYSNLKADNAKRIDEFLTEIQKLNEQKEANEKELFNVTEDRDNVHKLNEELRVKLLQLVEHYEGKISLLVEENAMLKTQRTALMQGAGSINVGMKHSSPDIVQTVASVTCEQPNLIQMNRDVIPKTERKNKETINRQDYADESRNMTKVVNRQPDIGNSTSGSRPPSSVNEKVVEKQPTLIPNIMYPPSMVQGHLYPNIPQEFSRPPRGEIATPYAVNDPLINAEPPSQVMPNRASIVEQPVLSGRGRLGTVPPVNVPTQQCPICTLDFPANLTEGAKTEHVNSHFE